MELFVSGNVQHENVVQNDKSLFATDMIGNSLVADTVVTDNVQNENVVTMFVTDWLSDIFARAAIRN